MFYKNARQITCVAALAGIAPFFGCNVGEMYSNLLAGQRASVGSIRSVTVSVEPTGGDLSTLASGTLYAGNVCIAKAIYILSSGSLSGNGHEWTFRTFVEGKEINLPFQFVGATSVGSGSGFCNYEFTPEVPGVYTVTATLKLGNKSKTADPAVFTARPAKADAK